MKTLIHSAAAAMRFRAAGKTTAQAPAEWDGTVRIGKTQSADGMTLNDCHISLQRQINVVTTTLTGRAGTVKEYVSPGDWALTLTIGLQGADGAYPADELERLTALLTLPQTIHIRCDFLDRLNIMAIAVTDIALEQQTHADYQEVTVNALSDDDYEIRSLVNA